MRQTLVQVVLAFGLMSCQRANQVPMSGKISLEFVRANEDGAEFWLSNGSKREISARGSYSFLKGNLVPWDTRLDCRSSAPYALPEVEAALVDGEHDVASISPGQRMKLIVPSNLPQKYQGGICSLDLRLYDDGTVVELSRFVP